MLASSLNRSSYGQKLTFTARVQSLAPGAPTPTGSVTFFDGATTLGSGTLNSLGSATFSTTVLTTGHHVITAVYGGDGIFMGSTRSGFAQTVTKDATATTILSSSPNPSTVGQAVTFVVRVLASAPGSGTPTGIATFNDRGHVLGNCTLTSGRATFTTATLTAGGHAITVVYAGDQNFSSSTSRGYGQEVHASPVVALIGVVMPAQDFSRLTAWQASVTELPKMGFPGPMAIDRYFVSPMLRPRVITPILAGRRASVRSEDWVGDWLS